MDLIWHGTDTLSSRKFICGYCGSPLASQTGYYARNKAGVTTAQIYICHECSSPTYFDRSGNQTPGVMYGNSVSHIPDDAVNSLYNEARNCTGYGAFTAAVLCCRKLLMNIAVSKGDAEGKNFTEYIEYLSARGYVPPDGKEWVDYIRQKGNEANHEITIMKKGDAEELLSFIEMLLKFIYEFPETIKRKSS